MPDSSEAGSSAKSEPRAAEWITWTQAAALVGCPVPTIDWYTRLGRITARPRHGSRPTLQRESVDDFALWWEQRQREREARRAQLKESKRPPSAPAGCLSISDAAALLGQRAAYVRRQIRDGKLDSRIVVGRTWLVDAQVQSMAQERAAWVSIATAACLLGCSARTVQRLTRQGMLVQRPVENRALPSLERASIDAYVPVWRERQEQEAARTAARAKLDEEERKLLDSVDVGRLLGITSSRVRQLARAERLPAIRRGNRWRYRVDHITLVIAARRFTTEAEGAST